MNLTQGSKCYFCLCYCKSTASCSDSYCLYHFFISRNALLYASIVLSASSSVCAYETKQVSNCEGGMKIFRFISSSNNLRNSLAFAFLALVSSFTFSRSEEHTSELQSRQ